MSIFWFVIHSITGCPDHDCVPANKGKKQLCKKCGREYFVFNVW